jgi:hypothetical protein
MKTITTIVIAGFTLALCGCTDAPMKGAAGGELSETQPAQTGTPRAVQAQPAPPPPPSQPVIEP